MGRQPQAPCAGIKVESFLKERIAEQKGKSTTAINQKISIEQYLERIAVFADDKHGRMIRNQFTDIRGSSELAMLVTPSSAEYEQLKKAIALMTPAEKQNAENLTDEQVKRIAADAKIDPANFAIFINGYALHCKRVS